MTAIIIVYILGYILSLFLMYICIPKGSKVDLGDILVALFASIASWATVTYFLIIMYSDKVIFIKK